MRLALARALVALLALSGAACVKPVRTPNLPRIFASARARPGKTPIIIIPGILGSQLANRTTGETVWPAARTSKLDDLDLPISPDLAENRDDVEPRGILDTTRLSRLLPEVRVYADLLVTLEKAAGYRLASMEDPPADGASDVFYVFNYDWRRDNVENARLFARKVDALKVKLGRPDLKFNILAHSMGGLIARYYALYGDQEPGDSAVPDWRGGHNISRLLLLGTPNQGSMDALRSLVEGYSFYGGNTKRSNLFNKLDADRIASLPAAYQLLPHPGTELYVNEGLDLTPMDLYDTKTWRENHWGVFGDAHIRALRSAFGPKAEDRELEEATFLTAVLARARLFETSLSRKPVAERPFSFFIFGGDCELTLRAPLIVTQGGKRRTYFQAQRVVLASGWLDRKRVLERMFAPGDGRVTRRSLLSEEEHRHAPGLFASSLGIDYAVFTCEVHGDLPNNSSMQNNILNILVTDVVSDARADAEP